MGFAKIATKSMIKTGLNTQSVFGGFTKNVFIVNYGCWVLETNIGPLFYLIWALFDSSKQLSV